MSDERNLQVRDELPKPGAAWRFLALFGAFWRASIADLQLFQ